MELTADGIAAVIETTLASRSGSAYWRKPLVKIIAADNPRFHDLKSAVSAGHLLPADVLPEAKSVIAFFIPFTERVAASNAGGKAASAEWARSYIETNEAIAAVSGEIENLLGKNGYVAGKIPATHNFDPKKLISNWSHRHVAQIAGLGSFGLNNMLITDAGCCGRLGSLVTDCVFPKTAVEYRERCLFKINQTCGVCVRKCAAGALTAGSYDRHACYGVCLENAERHKDIGYADVCGKCTVGLPCSLTDPSRARVAAAR